MYAVVRTGGKQYKVQEGEVLRIEKIAGDVGSAVTFDEVLMLSDGENIRIGQPVLEDASVNGKIVEQGKAKKILVFKYKRRKRYRRKQGHRQLYTAVKIDAITGEGIKPTQKRDTTKTEPAAKAGTKAAVSEKADSQAAAEQAPADTTKTRRARPREKAADKGKAAGTTPQKEKKAAVSQKKTAPRATARKTGKTAEAKKGTPRKTTSSGSASRKGTSAKSTAAKTSTGKTTARKKKTED